MKTAKERCKAATLRARLQVVALLVAAAELPFDLDHRPATVDCDEIHFGFGAKFCCRAWEREDGARHAGTVPS